MSHGPDTRPRVAHGTIASADNRENALGQDQAADLPGPIFVDPSGRRGRIVRRTSWVLGGLAGAYVVLVLLALIVPAGLGRMTVPGLGPLLPGPAAPLLSDSAGSPQRPAQLLVPSPSATAPASSVPTHPAAQAPSSAGATVTSTPAPAVPAPSTQPSPAATSPGHTVTAPGQSASHPVPRSTNAPAPKPHPTKA